MLHVVAGGEVDFEGLEVIERVGVAEVEEVGPGAIFGDGYTFVGVLARDAVHREDLLQGGQGRLLEGVALLPDDDAAAPRVLVEQVHHLQTGDPGLSAPDAAEVDMGLGPAVEEAVLLAVEGELSLHRDPRGFPDAPWLP